MRAGGHDDGGGDEDDGHDVDDGDNGDGDDDDEGRGGGAFKEEMLNNTKQEDNFLEEQEEVSLTRFKSENLKHLTRSFACEINVNTLKVNVDEDIEDNNNKKEEKEGFTTTDNTPRPPTGFFTLGHKINLQLLFSRNLLNGVPDETKSKFKFQPSPKTANCFHD